MTLVEATATEVVETTTNVEGWEDLIGLLDTQSGVCVVTMEQLRDIDGYGRLGGTVRAGIAKKLASMGIGTFAGENLPSDASANVVLFRLGTPVAELVNVIQNATTDNGWRNRAAYTAECMRRLNSVPEPELVSNSIIDTLKSLTAAAKAVGVDPTTI